MNSRLTRKIEIFLKASGCVVGLALVAGCSHGRIDREIDQEESKTAPLSRTELQEKATQTIETAPGMTDDQRAKLLSLRSSVHNRIEDLTDQSKKLRSLLVTEVLAQNSDPAKVKRIQKRMKAVENERLSAIFDAVDQANTILGRNTRVNPAVFDDIVSGRSGGEP